MRASARYGSASPRRHGYCGCRFQASWPAATSRAACAAAPMTPPSTRWMCATGLTACSSGAVRSSSARLPPAGSVRPPMPSAAQPRRSPTQRAARPAPSWTTSIPTPTSSTRCSGPPRTPLPHQHRLLPKRRRRPLLPRRHRQPRQRLLRLRITTAANTPIPAADAATARNRASSSMRHRRRRRLTAPTSLVSAIPASPQEGDSRR